MDNKQCGFTLIEMVIVIAIMSILIGLASLNYNIRDEIQAKNQIKEFVINLEYIRNNAILTGKKQTLYFSEDNLGYNFKLPYREENIKFNKLIRVRFINIPKDITFSELGKPSFIGGDNSAGTIIFEIKADIYFVKIIPVTGEIKYEKYKE